MPIIPDAAINSAHDTNAPISLNADPNIRIAPASENPVTRIDRRLRRGITLGRIVQIEREGTRVGDAIRLASDGHAVHPGMV